MYKCKYVEYCLLLIGSVAFNFFFSTSIHDEKIPLHFGILQILIWDTMKICNGTVPSSLYYPQRAQRAGGVRDWQNFGHVSDFPNWSELGTEAEPPNFGVKLWTLISLDWKELLTKIKSLKSSTGKWLSHQKVRIIPFPVSIILFPV